MPLARSLREVDVGDQPSLACPLNQAEKGGALGGPRATPDDDDDSMMRLYLREPEEIISIAGNENVALVVAKPQNSIVWTVRGQGLAEESHVVLQLDQQKTEFVWNVVIQQEFHSAAEAICRATRRSISPRWSS